MAKLVSDGVIGMVQVHACTDGYFKQAADLGVPTIRAYIVRSKEDVAVAASSEADIVLLDAGMGDGRTFDWSLLEDAGFPYMLSGGLDPTNVREAVRRLDPYGVDVSSGVETNGSKDPTKMTAFVYSARGDFEPKCQGELRKQFRSPFEELDRAGGDVVHRPAHIDIVELVVLGERLAYRAHGPQGVQAARLQRVRLVPDGLGDPVGDASDVPVRVPAQSGVDGAAARVPENDDEGAPEVGASVLHAAEDAGVDDVPGDAYDEQIADPAGEDGLGDLAGVGAADDDGEGVLPLHRRSGAGERGYVPDLVPAGQRAGVARAEAPGARRRFFSAALCSRASRSRRCSG